MPLHQVINNQGKRVTKYYLPMHFKAISFNEADFDKVRQFRRINADNKRIVKACAILLGWLGDTKQPFTIDENWPIELYQELDQATWRAEGIVE